MLFILVLKAKTFKEAADVLRLQHQPLFVVLRSCFKTMPDGVQIPEVIEIDEYKADIAEGKYKTEKRNSSKVIKSNACGFRKHKYFKRKILLSRAEYIKRARITLDSAR